MEKVCWESMRSFGVEVVVDGGSLTNPSHTKVSMLSKQVYLEGKQMKSVVSSALLSLESDFENGCDKTPAVTFLNPRKVHKRKYNWLLLENIAIVACMNRVEMY